MTSISSNYDLADKIYCLLKDWLKDKSRGLSYSVKKIIQETEFIDTLQQLVDYGNLHILKSFKIRLEMEEDADSDNFVKNGGTT